MSWNGNQKATFHEQIKFSLYSRVCTYIYWLNSQVKQKRKRKRAQPKNCVCIFGARWMWFGRNYRWSHQQFTFLIEFTGELGKQKKIAHFSLTNFGPISMQINSHRMETIILISTAPLPTFRPMFGNHLAEIHFLQRKFLFTFWEC